MNQHTDLKHESIIETSLFETPQKQARLHTRPELVWILPYPTTLYCGSHVPYYSKVRKTFGSQLVWNTVCRKYTLIQRVLQD